MRTALRSLLLLGLLVCVPQILMATPVKWVWEGTLTGTGQWADLVPPDTPFSMTFQWDTDEPSIIGDCGGRGGVYPMSGTFSILGVDHPAGGWIERSAWNGNCTPIPSLDFRIHPNFGPTEWQFDGSHSWLHDGELIPVDLPEGASGYLFTLTGRPGIISGVATVQAVDPDCTYAAAPNPPVVDYTGAEGLTFTVTTNLPECGWWAFEADTLPDSMIDTQTFFGTRFTGTQTLSYNVVENPYTDPRTGTIEISDLPPPDELFTHLKAVITVLQAGRPTAHDDR